MDIFFLFVLVLLGGDLGQGAASEVLGHKQVHQVIVETISKICRFEKCAYEVSFKQN